MSRKGQAVALSAAEFMRKHASEVTQSEEVISTRLLASIFSEGKIPASELMAPGPRLIAWQQRREQLPGYQLMRELKQYWLVRLLKVAREENSPEAYRELLEGWLIRLGIEPPTGVLVPPRRSRGAPRKESTEQIYRIWVTNDRPQWSTLAYQVYRTDNTKADASQRKKLRDRCQHAVKRYETALRDAKSSN
jgi:hypothetical protein